MDHKGNPEWEDPKALSSFEMCPEQRPCPADLLKKRKGETPQAWDERITGLMVDGYTDAARGKIYFKPHPHCSMSCRWRWLQSIFRSPLIYDWLIWVETCLATIFTSFHASHAASVAEINRQGAAFTRSTAEFGPITLGQSRAFCNVDNERGLADQMGSMSLGPCLPKKRECCPMAQLAARPMYRLWWIPPAVQPALLRRIVQNHAWHFNLRHVIAQMGYYFDKGSGSQDVHPVHSAGSISHNCKQRWKGLIDHWPRLRECALKAPEWGILALNVAAERTCLPVASGIAALVPQIFQFAALGQFTSVDDQPVWSVPRGYREAVDRMARGAFFRARLVTGGVYRANFDAIDDAKAERKRREEAKEIWLPRICEWAPGHYDEPKIVQRARQVKAKRKAEAVPPALPTRPASQRERRPPAEFSDLSPTLRGDEADAAMAAASAQEAMDLTHSESDNDA